MSKTLHNVVFLSAVIGIVATGAARADCESDLIRLEQAYKTPGLTAAAKAALDEAKPIAIAALKHDKDAVCNQAIVAALAKAGLSSTAAAQPAKQSAVAMGDLKPFRAIAADTLKIVDAGDLPAGKARIKALETAWDDAAATMKARNAADWKTLDVAIDKALEALRASKPDKGTCAGSLQALITAFDAIANKA